MTQTIPEWDRLDRLAKSLRHAQLTTQEMADYLGVHRETVSRWLNGRSRPSVGMIRAWSMRTGVDYDWLQTGELAHHGDLRARRDSNPKPSDLRHAA